MASYEEKLPLVNLGSSKGYSKKLLKVSTILPAIVSYGTNFMSVSSF